MMKKTLLDLIENKILQKAAERPPAMSLQAVDFSPMSLTNKELSKIFRGQADRAARKKSKNERTNPATYRK